jgi:hypothetical protein
VEAEALFVPALKQAIRKKDVDFPQSTVVLMHALITPFRVRVSPNLIKNKSLRGYMTKELMLLYLKGHSYKNLCEITALNYSLGLN